MKRAMLATLAGLLTLICAVALTLYLRYGGGEPYPDVTGPPRYSADRLEVVVTSPQPVGNVAVSATGRVFYTLHPEADPQGPKLLEWWAGRPRAWPSPEAQAQLDSPLGVVVDRQERLWVIDPARHGAGTAQLLAFDVASGEQLVRITFPETVAPWGSFLQDLQVDRTGSTVFIADASFWRQSPALVVVDVKSGAMGRVLEGHPSVKAQDYLVRNHIKTMTFFGGLSAFKIGVDGIALDKSEMWLYWGAMVNDTLYRARTSELRAAALRGGPLPKVEPVGKKPLNDGLSADMLGRVLVTDVEHGAVVRMSMEGELETLVKTERLRWPDALSFGPDGWLYIADSALPHVVLTSPEHIKAHAPYHIYRLRLQVGSIPGH